MVSASLEKNKSDYYHEMNAPHFDEWFRVKVLPSLPDESAVVIDNVCGHR